MLGKDRDKHMEKWQRSIGTSPSDTDQTCTTDLVNVNFAKKEVMVPPVAVCGGNQEDEAQKRKQAMVQRLKLEKCTPITGFQTRVIIGHSMLVTNWMKGIGKLWTQDTRRRFTTPTLRWKIWGVGDERSLRPPLQRVVHIG